MKKGKDTLVSGKAKTAKVSRKDQVKAGKIVKGLGLEGK